MSSRNYWVFQDYVLSGRKWRCRKQHFLGEKWNPIWGKVSWMDLKAPHPLPDRTSWPACPHERSWSKPLTPPHLHTTLPIRRLHLGFCPAGRTADEIQPTRREAAPGEPKTPASGLWRRGVTGRWPWGRGQRAAAQSWSRAQESYSLVLRKRKQKHG